MNPLISLLQCLALIIPLFITISVSATPLNIPLLSPNAGTFVQGNYFAHDHPKPLSAFDPDTEFETFYYNQTLDHFNFRPDSFNIFQQRYLINFKHWGGSNISAPIFAYLGEEEAIDADLSIIGFLSENANQFQALQIFIEVRQKEFHACLHVAILSYSYFWKCSLVKLIHIYLIINLKSAYHKYGAPLLWAISPIWIKGRGI
ncbi:uncharacterized protein [Malus domestica]|uniref:uncharacterized protein n=1 Tax=Malus domestica TaxID=3750 RepID=UPI003974AE2A